MHIFRALPSHKAVTTDVLPPRLTARAPGNVPYLVDNLWEWVRPSHLPCRRRSVYASPSPGLALASGADGSTPYRVELQGHFKAAQLRSDTDSKYHPECRTLPRRFLQHLGQSWLEAPLQAKRQLAPLWMPCLTKEQIDETFQMAEAPYRIDAKALAEEIHYWHDVRLIKCTDDIDPDGGEVFFEPTDGYRLIPVHE